MVFEILLTYEAHIEFEGSLVACKSIKVRKVTMLDHAEVLVGFFIHLNRPQTSTSIINLTILSSRSHILSNLG